MGAAKVYVSRVSLRNVFAAIDRAILHFHQVLRSLNSFRDSRYHLCTCRSRSFLSFSYLNYILLEPRLSEAIKSEMFLVLQAFL